VRAGKASAKRSVVTPPAPSFWIEAVLRTTLVSAVALVATASSAPAAGVFDAEQCVELVSKDARIVAVIPPGSSDDNEATAFPVDDLPAIESGDLVRVKPAQGDAAPLPTFSVIERHSKKCKKFWRSRETEAREK
jgi:hypothetical protein